MENNKKKQHMLKIEKLELNFWGNFGSCRKK